jgi:hypothetical protein
MTGGLMNDGLRWLVGGVNGALGGTGSLSNPMAVVKYCQFPPEGAGNVSVSNEYRFYACLEVEQFLNDAIIDFYLKLVHFFI